MNNRSRIPSSLVEICRQEVSLVFFLFLGVLGVWHYAYLGYNSLPGVQVSPRSF